MDLTISFLNIPRNIKTDFKDAIVIPILKKMTMSFYGVRIKLTFVNQLITADNHCTPNTVRKRSSSPPQAILTPAVSNSFNLPPRFC